MIPGLSSLTTKAMDPKDPKAVAAKVQSMFMEIMIKSMEDSIGSEDGLFGNSSAAEIYRSMVREQLGATMGDKIGGSIQDALEKGMTKAQSQILKLDSTEGLGGLEGIEGFGGAGALAIPGTPRSSVTHEPMSGLPVAGIVTSEIGWRKDPFTGAMAFHKGMDIAAPQGTSIRAVASGTVLESGAKGEYGNAIVIQTDDGRRMLYGHNSANFVRVGDRVAQGDAIAAVGATGRATGPHVHFEVSE